MNKKLASLVLACLATTTFACAKQTQTFQQYNAGTTNFAPQQYGYYNYAQPNYAQPAVAPSYTQNNVALPPIQVPVANQYTNITNTQLQVSDYMQKAEELQKVNNTQPSYYEQQQVYSAPQQPVYTAQQTQAYTQQPLQGQVVMVPAGSVVPAVAQMYYSTENLALGQTVSFVLPQGFYYNGIEVAPAGSVVQGTVINYKKAGRGTRNGLLQVKFTSIITPNGQNIPIAGSIKTDDGTGIIHGGTKFDTSKEYAKDLAAGAAGGAVMGTVMGALSGGKVGRGAVYGTAVGAGLGLVKSFWDEGENVEIPVNSCVDVILEQPLTFNPALYR